MWKRIPTILLVAAAMVLTGCTRDDRGARSESREPMDHSAADGQKGGEPASTKAQSFTGTLQGGIAAGGGETTGWILAGDGAAGGLDVDVSKVKADAERLNGQRVKVSGRMTERNWPERGKTHVLVAHRIERADPQP